MSTYIQNMIDAARAKFEDLNSDPMTDEDWRRVVQVVLDECPPPVLMTTDIDDRGPERRVRTPTASADLIAAECDALKDMLLCKNAQYGDSAINPLRIASKADEVEQIKVRIDDKLSRIARGDGTGDEDAWLDLVGYVILMRVVRRKENERNQVADSALDVLLRPQPLTPKPPYPRKKT